MEEYILFLTIPLIFNPISVDEYEFCRHSSKFVHYICPEMSI